MSNATEAGTKVHLSAWKAAVAYFAFGVLLAVGGCTGNAWAEFGDAIVEGDEEKGFAAIRRAAERGEPDAQGVVAWMYHQGRGVPKDQAEAFKWAQRSAEAGDPLGQSYMATFYFADGPDRERDLALARRWAQPAADKGVAIAQLILGMVLLETDQTPEGQVEARKWIMLSEITGSRTASTFRIPRVGDSPKAEQSSPLMVSAKERAREWLSRRSVTAASVYEKKNLGENKKVAIGSGIAVAQRGSNLFILSSAHLVQGCPRLNVEGGTRVDVVGLLPKIALNSEDAKPEKAGSGDLALLAVRSFGQQTKIAKLGDGRPLTAGERVVVAGYPSDKFQIVSGSANRLSDEYHLGLNVEVTPGFSGGPVVDSRGMLVGMTIGGYWAGPFSSLMGRPSQRLGVAVQAASLRSFLELYDLYPERHELSGPISGAELNTVATRIAIRVECFGA